ncbi:hypothetical protein [Marinomonas balearica]|uniref:Uncharacterized protein n=1 Tax=Marinomonas balearica TaxID=491947 RepID=A0A4R6MEF2_9GAMM|nr:hypothetical protein [Marinomonas balearica]TDO99816.1 hypothetical protein DFP79_0824 [Marinomonas balearica]
MMIVDLVDEVDFKEMLKGIGAPISESMTLEDVQHLVAEWKTQSSENVTKLDELIVELNNDQITVLPEVQSVIDIFKSLS